jgi:hypothetical protein
VMVATRAVHVSVFELFLGRRANVGVLDVLI